MDTTRAHTDPEAFALRGLDLRSAVVLVLLERQRPATIRELVAQLRRDGFELGSRPGKDIADALRWEVRRGRVVRWDRGIYGPGVVAKVTKHRMRARIARTQNRSTER